MAKNRVLSPAQKAIRQSIDAGFASSSALGERMMTKAELRASIPSYDESLVKKVQPKKKPTPRTSPKK